MKRFDTSKLLRRQFANFFSLFFVLSGRRASVDFLKANKEITREIELEVRDIMAKKLSAGGATTSSDDDYDEEEDMEEGGSDRDGEDSEFQSDV